MFGLTWRAFRLALSQRADIYGVLLKLFTRAKGIYDSHEVVSQPILTKHWIPAPLRRPLASQLKVLKLA